MEPIRIEVNLGNRSYAVLIGCGDLGNIGTLLRAHRFSQRNAFVITNAEVAALYYEELRASLAATDFTEIVRHEIPGSESGKNWDEFSRACAALLAAFPESAAVPLVILLGGGVIGDLGGFVAGVFRRGVPFVQIPTTLLAAVDSSVGGKVAVNFGGAKNVMGVFHQPGMVLCDLNTLGTLSARELRSGAAEIIKYGAVCSAPLFEQLERGDLEKLLAHDRAVLPDIVAQCVRLKARIVEDDERDTKGIRNVLNFGHTIGHALELTTSERITHGEAISIGMVAATRLGRALGTCDESFHTRLLALLERAGLPTSHPDQPALFERILHAMRMDKKFRAGKNLFILPVTIGQWEQREDVPWPAVHDALRSVLVPLM